MVELGQWEKALSVAPGVSMKYWKKLMQRRADQLMDEDNDDAIPFCIATGDVQKLVTFFTRRGQLLEALLIAQVWGRGHRAPMTSAEVFDQYPLRSGSLLLHDVCTELAEWYFQDGCSVLAACCHLAVDNVKLAMSSLIRGNELELAASVGVALGEAANQSTAYCLELLARKYMTPPTCCFSSILTLSADLLQMIPDNHALLVKLCAFIPGSPAEIQQLHQKCGLPAPEDCGSLAEEALRDGDLFSALELHLLSSEPERALQIGIAHVKEQLVGSDWTVDVVHPILDLLSYIRTERLIMTKMTEARSELLILCGYIGALLAISRNYTSIVPALYEYTSQLMKRREVSVPLKIEQLSVELDAWRACAQNNGVYVTPPYFFRAITLTNQRLCDYVTGSNLPSHSDLQLSCFTGQRIQGPVFLLEDNKSAISLNDALMWAKVNPFSPLGTGLRINPF
uniref:Gem-associated protein 5 TPR domain-containing protein n=1 Tax=Oryzias latipes TaxID=8090 RepID=A0A3P9JTL4_ORYLA